ARSRRGPHRDSGGRRQSSGRTRSAHLTRCCTRHAESDGSCNSMFRVAPCPMRGWAQLVRAPCANERARHIPPTVPGCRGGGGALPGGGGATSIGFGREGVICFPMKLLPPTTGRYSQFPPMAFGTGSVLREYRTVSEPTFIALSRSREVPCGISIQT